MAKTYWLTYCLTQGVTTVSIFLSGADLSMIHSYTADEYFQKSCGYFLCSYQTCLMNKAEFYMYSFYVFNEMLT